MNYKRIQKPEHLQDHTPSMAEAFPYMIGACGLRGGCLFDYRHFVYDTIDGFYPFSLTTRINASNQIWLCKEVEL